MLVWFLLTVEKVTILVRKDGKDSQELEYDCKLEDSQRS